MLGEREAWGDGPTRGWGIFPISGWQASSSEVGGNFGQCLDLCGSLVRKSWEFGGRFVCSRQGRLTGAFGLLPVDSVSSAAEG